jgi:hypothetical protein
MNGEPGMQPAKIQEAREKVVAAIEAAEGADPQLLEALQASLSVLNDLAAEKQARRSPLTPSIEYTLEDDDAAGRREFDVRVFYGWTDYDPVDEPNPIWGAHVEDVQLVAVRHYDREGNLVDWQTHAGITAWDRLEQEHDRVLEACTNDGALRGLGRVHPLFTPVPSRATPADTGSALRMAPSARVRAVQLRPRFFG